MNTAEKVRENRIRRAADRQGVVLRKSRRRDERAADFGTYLLIDPTYNTIVLGDRNTGFGFSLDDVETWLNGERA